MTQEEKARAYDEALERARQFSEHPLQEDSANVVEYIFPELCESEDERMKKELIKFLQECHNIDSGFFSRYCEIPFAQMLAWLEKQGTSYTKKDVDNAYVEGMAFAKKKMNSKKQGEQKSAWSEEDKERYISCLQRLSTGNPAQPETINTKWFKERVYPLIFGNLSGEQNSAWSEEDETALGDALWCCKQAASIAKDENDMGNAWYAENWLKSLKGRVQPKQEWSEDDEAHINSITDYLLDYKLLVYEEDMNVANGVQKELDWLKSLKQRIGG